MHKLSRIDALAHPMQKGEIYFNSDENASQYERWHYEFRPEDVADILELKKELTEHPHSGGQDDLADALSMLNDTKISARPPHTAASAPKQVMTPQLFRSMLEDAPSVEDAWRRRSNEEMWKAEEAEDEEEEW